MSSSAVSAVDTVDVFTSAQARRVAAMLDMDPQGLAFGDKVPRGWHFAMLAGETPRQALRTDGFPGLGVVMPQLDRPRLLLGQRVTNFEADIVIGTPIRRHSAIASIVEKDGRSGPLSIVNIEHVLSSGRAADGAGSVRESQTYYLAGLPPAEARVVDTPTVRSAPAIPNGGQGKVVTPDDIMLFQYSALGFNTHRIHFDRDYARTVEGHPDLVVNGGLATLLATEFLRTDLGKKLKSLSARHLAPLYVNRPLTILVAELTHAAAALRLFDSNGVIAAEIGVTFDVL